MYQILMRNIGLNGAANVRAYPVALGETGEDRPIYENPDVNRASASLMDTGQSRAAAVVRVEVLDRFLRDLGVGAIGALKVDVEGWELQVLLGAKELLSSDTAPVLVVEYSTAVPVRTGQRKDLHEFLTTVNDYQVFKLKRGKGSISLLQRVRGADDLPRHDNLFCFRAAHLRDDVRELFADPYTW
jgi:FkbM family methyltransferase